MSRPRHRFAAGAASALMLGLVALSPTAPVSALDQAANTFRVSENQTVTKDFPPIAAEEPLPGLGNPVPPLDTPKNCQQAAYCDVVPLEVVVPSTLQPSDEFFVSVTLAWKTQALPGTGVTPAQTLNDMDLYVWDNPQKDDPIQQSSTSAEPEQLRIFRPTKGKYSIVVMNYLGPNTGYTLTVTYKPEKIVPPFESLAPEASAANPATPASTPVDLSGGSDASAPSAGSGGASASVPAATGPSSPAIGAAPLPAPVPAAPDPDFSNFNDKGFDQEFAAPPSDVLKEKVAKAVGPPKPTSAGTLILWLAVAPLLLLAAGGFWLSRKGSAVLKLR